MTIADSSEQLFLPGLTVPKRRRPTKVDGQEIADDLPVARIALEVAPAHLDRGFDYLVPKSMADGALVGTRVRVRFGGKDVDGVILERLADTDHEGRLLPIRRLVSAVPVATRQTLALCRAVADHYAGTLSDVLRCAIPPRHARAETTLLKEIARDRSLSDSAASIADITSAVLADSVRLGNGGFGFSPSPTDRAQPGDAKRGNAQPGGARPDGAHPWAPYRAGEAFVQRVLTGESPRAVWSSLPPAYAPVPSWATAIVQAVEAALVSGRTAIVVLPDNKTVDVMMAALVHAGLAPWDHQKHGTTAVDDANSRNVVAKLQADEGPEARFRAFTATVLNQVRVVVGTRAAAFAPLRDLGLVVCWDDDDQSHEEVRQPGFHTREVLRIRAQLENAAFLTGAFGRSLQAQQLVETGWAQQILADRAHVRALTPRVSALDSTELAREGAGSVARIPSRAWQAIKAGLEKGPVLVQVPRAGYLPAVACARCRTRAECKTCHGPLQLHGQDSIPQCTWCGALAANWRCRECGCTELRSVLVGSVRTAEELGRAFPKTTIRMSGLGGAGGLLTRVDARPQLVVSTPGAEPMAEGGYVVAALLDAGVATAREGLGTDVSALRRWLAAASLVRPSKEGGQVLLVGDASRRPTDALVRWDPAGFAARELGERRELQLPPAARVATVVGDPNAVAAFVDSLHLPDGAAILGPMPVRHVNPEVYVAPGSATISPVSQGFEPSVRIIIRSTPEGQPGSLAEKEFAKALTAARAKASASRLHTLVRVEMDPSDL